MLVALVPGAQHSWHCPKLNVTAGEAVVPGLEDLANSSHLSDPGLIFLAIHQENVPFVFGVFVSRKASLVTLALGNLSLSVLSWLWKGVFSFEFLSLTSF